MVGGQIGVTGEAAVWHVVVDHKLDHALVPVAAQIAEDVVPCRGYAIHMAVQVRKQSLRVLLRTKSDFLSSLVCLSKIKVHIIYRANFQLKIRTGSLIILTVIW